jgi:cytochrome c peroxidase
VVKKVQILLNKNKKAVFIIILTGIIISCLLSAFTEKKSAAEQTRSYSLENIKEMQQQLDSFQLLVIQKADQKSMLKKFKNIRIIFKQFECILEYFDSRSYAFFNGVNAVEMDDGFNPNAKPEGLQVIESELFNDTINYDRIFILTNQLKYRTLSFYMILRDAEISNTYIFEAIRFNLIRMETMGLVSFDSPDIRNNTAELISGFKAIQKIISFYKEENTATIENSLFKKIQDAVIYLSAKSFNQLDRLFFIKKFIQPVTKEVMLFQQKLSVPYLEKTGQIFRAVNLNAANIYEPDFLNTKFYAQDKYYKDNPYISFIGKKLFYDKRMSADRTMSCGTCHQPSNFFTDKMPTAITNQNDDFQKRNTPTLLNVALQPAYFYDLSALTLETQIEHVMSNPKEFNHAYDSFLLKIKADTQYVRLFSLAFPEFKNESISSYTINTCISDFERKMIQLNSPFDKYMRGQTNIIDASVKRGFNLFMGKAQCGSCHFAPTFFGNAPPFYGIAEAEVLGVTKIFDTIHPVLDDDIGRFKNFEIEQFKFAMKTSTVRNSALTAPYMHNGGFKTLDEVIEFYNRGGGAGLGLNIPNQTLVADRLNLSKQDKKDIVSFIKALTDTSEIKSFANEIN